MARYYYSVQPFLAWCLGHYFYKGAHFAYVGAPFYPYRLENPRTSSGLRIYEDYYEPWKDEDEYSIFIDSKRLRLLKGVQKAPRTLRPELRRICNQIDMAFFYPVVYRVDIAPIQSSAPARLQKGGSGRLTPGKCKTPSNEYVLNDLHKGEFDLIFADLETEIAAQQEHIAMLTSIQAPGGTVASDDTQKLTMYETLKKLLDEQNTLTDTQVLALLKTYSRI